MFKAEHPLSILNPEELFLSSVGQISDSIEYFEQRQQDASQKMKTMLAESENLYTVNQLTHWSRKKTSR